MKKNLTLIIALLFSAAVFAQKNKSEQVPSKIYQGVPNAVKTENGSTYLMLQVEAGSANPVFEKLKLVYEADGTTLKINAEAKDLVVNTAAGKKLGDKYVRKTIKVSCLWLGGTYVVSNVQLL